MPPRAVATADSGDPATQPLAAVFTTARVIVSTERVAFTLAGVEDCLPAWVAVFTTALVAECMPVRVAVFTTAPVVDCIAAWVVVFTQVLHRVIRRTPATGGLGRLASRASWARSGPRKTARADKVELLRGTQGSGAQLKPQIPWLRVFVEGVVILGGRL